MLKYYKLMGKISESAKMVNKKNKKFVPIVYEDIEYQNFKKRNKTLVNNLDENDDTLMDGLDEKSSYINPIMKQLF